LLTWESMATRPGFHLVGFANPRPGAASQAHHVEVLAAWGGDGHAPRAVLMRPAPRRDIDRDGRRHLGILEQSVCADSGIRPRVSARPARLCGGSCRCSNQRRSRLSGGVEAADVVGRHRRGGSAVHRRSPRSA